MMETREEGKRGEGGDAFRMHVSIPTHVLTSVAPSPLPPRPLSERSLSLYDGQAQGCCICDSGCDHSLETGSCGTVDGDYYNYYADRPNNPTTCAESTGEWLDGVRYTHKYGYEPGHLMCDSFGADYLVAEVIIFLLNVLSWYKILTLNF